MLLLTATIVCLVGVVNSESQGITASGGLTCNGEPLTGANVKFIERDRFVFDPDDLVANVKTDSEGMFHITGRTEEITSIEPYLHFYYRCGSTDCQHFSIRIDDKFIETGDDQRPYDFGIREVSNITGVYMHENC
ncbi:unnamed protein product [Bursaphelenchus okinawaensis]|uniref:Transthyretin-like family protein n=1 Tax=Bursaphelenchus okinawaensis TaxID=465554 RepID=A0A811L9D2_9BILA|nr:unnamed protein product [Bursaphelenchus okinawaensis]CAG9118719.1 unnamed protein product [Bursaphelenchus okinawaensis]